MAAGDGAVRDGRAARCADPGDPFAIVRIGVARGPACGRPGAGDDGGQTTTLIPSDLLPPGNHMDETENSGAETDEAPAFDLTSWLEGRRGDPVRLSAREDDGWVDREKFVERDESYTLAADPDEEVRYQLRVDDDGADRVEKWIRYSFTETSKFVSGTPSDAIEIVLEVHESVIDGVVPWANADTIEFSTSALGYGTESGGIEPVNARRVAGLEEQKQRLDRFLDTGRREWGLAEETGILLEGPPGTGKTELVMEVCQERYGSLPVMISGPEFLSKWVGESEKILREKFDEARDSRHKILYIDEIDAVTRERGELHEDYSARIVSQLLVLLDGVEAKQTSEDDEEDRSLKVIASTNLPHIVDEALLRPGRLGARPISFDRPDRTARKAILHHYLERIYTSERGQLGPRLRAFVTGEDVSVLDDLVEETEGFTGANLEDLIQESVSRLREEGRSRLDLETVRRVYEESFSPSDELVSIELSEEDLTTDGPEIPPDTRMVRLGPGDGTEEQAREVARAYFGQLSEATDRPMKYTFRKINPGSMIDRETAQTESNVIDAFEHAETERICLYVEDTANLVRVKKHSSVVENLIGLLNEQLLGWNEENLLIVDPMSDEQQEEFSSFTPLPL